MTLESDISAEVKASFEAIFELKLAAFSTPPGSRLLDLDEQALLWNLLLTAIPEILPHCSAFTTHPSPKHSQYTLGLWDFLNGREISLSVNHCGGYDLSINADDIRWVETQLPLNLLCLKLLALDSVPVELRAMSC